MLGKVVNERQTDWDLWLPYVMAAYRSSRHESTGYTPNFLTLHREVRAPVDVVLGTGEVPITEVNYDGFVEDVRQRMQSAYNIVRRNIGEAAAQNKRYYDVPVRPMRYKVGDWLYYYNPRRHQGRQDKWSRKYSGPFLIVAVLGPVNVRLQRSKRTRPFVVHIDKVKPFLGDTPSPWIRTDGMDGVDVADESCDPENVECRDDPVTQGPEQPVADVVTFTEDSEFRRTRPRRNAPRPRRYRD